MSRQAEQRTGGGGKPKRPDAVLLPPLCPRPLLLSQPAIALLEDNDKWRNWLRLGIVIAAACCLLAAHVFVGSSAGLQARNRLRHIHDLIQFPFPSVRTPCVVIHDLPAHSKRARLTLRGLSYALPAGRFGRSRLATSFAACYLLYQRHSPFAGDAVRFEHGAFLLPYRHAESLSDEADWWLQPLAAGDVDGGSVGQWQRLSLSVRTRRSGAAGAPAPVVVVVGGSDLVVNKPTLPPDSVVDDLDCVVAVVNYRLGLFGAADLGRDGFDGNLAARDLAAALRWLRIAAPELGGDPRSILLMGHQAGATLAWWLMQSPESELVSRVWLTDPSVQLPGSSGEPANFVIGDIFTSQRQRLTELLGSVGRVSACESQFQLRRPLRCLRRLPPRQLLRLTPPSVAGVFRFLDEFPDVPHGRQHERSLVWLPGSKWSSLQQLRLGLVRRRQPVAVLMSSHSQYYSSLFANRRNHSRQSVQLELTQSLLRCVGKRQAQAEAEAGELVRQYEEFAAAALPPEQPPVVTLNFARRLLLHDIRQLCPLRLAARSLAAAPAAADDHRHHRHGGHPLYAIVDVGPWWIAQMLWNGTSVPCHLPRQLAASSSSSSSSSSSRPSCELTPRAEGRSRQSLSEYLAKGRRMLREFAHGSVSDETMLAASARRFDATVNLLDHLGAHAGVDNRRSSLAKATCSAFYGGANAWDALMLAARLN